MRECTRRLIGAVLALCLTPMAFGVTLSLDSAPDLPDSEGIHLPVRLTIEPAEAVASLQFDLNYDPDVLRFEKVVTEATALQAEKSAHTNVLRPGLLRVVVAGFNQNVINAGPLVTVQFENLGGSSASAAISMERAIVSDPMGSPVHVVVTPNTMVLELHAGALKAQLVTGTSVPAKSGDPYATYRALTIALLCVAGAMIWSRRTPRKRRSR